MSLGNIIKEGINRAITQTERRKREMERGSGEGDQAWVQKDGENNRCLAVGRVENEWGKRKIGLSEKCIITGSESRREG